MPTCRRPGWSTITRWTASATWNASRPAKFGHMIDIFDTEIRHSTLVRASPEQVYDAFTTAEGLDGWFTSGAEVDPRPGGEIRFRWVDWGPDRVTDEDGGL